MRHLQQVKISGVRADARFNHGRTRPFEQFFCIDIGRFRSDLGSDFPFGESFTLAQAGVGQGEAHMVIPNPKIFRSFGHAIWGQIFGLARLKPLAAQHKWRAHDCPAAAVKPFFLLAGSRKTGLVEQCNLPPKLDFIVVTLFQFGPRGLCPKTPGRDDVQIIGDCDMHGVCKVNVLWGSSTSNGVG